MYAIDTAEAIRKLTAADMPEAQARVIVDTFKHPDAEVATKTDLETSINGLKQELKADNKALKQELRQEFGKDLETGIKGLKQELKADSRELRAEFRTELKWIKWAIGANLSFTLLIVLKLVFF